jgi:hypothetical protein
MESTGAAASGCFAKVCGAGPSSPRAGNTDAKVEIRSTLRTEPRTRMDLSVPALPTVCLEPPEAGWLAGHSPYASKTPCTPSAEGCQHRLPLTCPIDRLRSPHAAESRRSRTAHGGLRASSFARTPARALPAAPNASNWRRFSATRFGGQLHKSRHSPLPVTLSP